MLMKKRLIIGVLLCVLFVTLGCGYFIVDNSNDKIVLKNEKASSKMHTNALTMMYETKAGSGEYMVSSDSTWPQEGYTFNERLSGCENGSTLTWDDERKAVILSTNVSDKCYVYFDKEPDIIYLADYIKNNVYTGTDGENGLYYHDGIGSYTNADQEAGDYSYRYSGANPNNYVCFGSGDVPCPTNNLYRIIGIFNNEVKLIKYDYIDSDWGGDYSGTYSYLTTNYKGSMEEISVYYWNGNNTMNNIWSESYLNTNNLNSNYYSSLTTLWRDMIASHDWIVTIRNYSDIVNSLVKNSYINEILNNITTTYTDEIGLMYASDYGYAASPESWNIELSSYDAESVRNNNWMYMGLYEWGITAFSDGSAFTIHDGGGATFEAIAGFGQAIRPAFYLKDTVILTDGSGTQNDPYIISIA